MTTTQVVQAWTALQNANCLRGCLRVTSSLLADAGLHLRFTSSLIDRRGRRLPALQPESAEL